MRHVRSYCLAPACSGAHPSIADREAGSIPRVIDFACGSGSFLVAAVDQLLGHLKRQDPNRAWAREIVEGGHIVGIDVDAKAVTAARLHLWQRLIEEPHALPLPNLSQFVRQADGLDAESWGDLAGEYDVVLGNPPFLATTLVTNREQLEATYVTARGRYDFSSLFVERAVQILKPDGVLGLVIPNRLFINKSAQPLRQVLTTQCHLNVIVDFGSTKLFDADAYVGCIVARRTTQTSRREPVRVVKVSSLERDFMTSELMEAEAQDVGTDRSQLVSYAARQPSADPEHTLPLLAYLNSPLISQFAERQAPTFRGNFLKFEPGVISAIPVLNAVLDNDAVMQELATLAQNRMNAEATGDGADAIEQAIDELLARTAQGAGIDLAV